MQIGTLAHELGHAINLPDTYDTDYTSFGVGQYDLMAAGSYYSSFSPVHMNAWFKELYGWVTAYDIGTKNVKNLLLSPITDDFEILKFQIPSVPTEYYVIENRPQDFSQSNTYSNGFKTLANLNAKDSGLLIWHVDTTKFTNSDENNRLIDIEQSDGLRNLDRNRVSGSGNSADLADSYPGIAGKTEFSYATFPNSNAYNGDRSGLRIFNIKRTGSPTNLDIKLSWKINDFSTKKIPAPIPTYEPPPGWFCLDEYWNNNDGCDCSCGAPDPDCERRSWISINENIFNDGIPCQGYCLNGVCTSNNSPSQALTQTFCSLPSGWQDISLTNGGWKFGVTRNGLPCSAKAVGQRPKQLSILLNTESIYEDSDASILINYNTKLLKKRQALSIRVSSDEGQNPDILSRTGYSCVSQISNLNQDKNAGKIRVRLQLGNTLLGLSQKIPMSVNKWYKIRAVANGNKITCEIENTETNESKSVTRTNKAYNAGGYRIAIDGGNMFINQFELS